jgi:hypothetical protein
MDNFINHVVNISFWKRLTGQCFNENDIVTRDPGICHLRLSTNGVNGANYW